MIRSFEEFCRELRRCGFSMGGGSAKGIYAVTDYDWTDREQAVSPLRWYCGNPEVDPWEWRIRVLEECSDIAYSKMFFMTSGFITRDWYPCFYAVRRKGESFEEAYIQGAVSHIQKRIYDIVAEGETPLHEIKTQGGFGNGDKTQFDRALLELQMGLYITVSGRERKKNRFGLDYGWNNIVFDTVEHFWNRRGFTIPRLDATESSERIRKQILRLNPEAEEARIQAFIEGSALPGGRLNRAAQEVVFSDPSEGKTERT